MVQAKVIGGTRLSSVPNQDPGTHWVICVLTDLPAGCNNAFYMDEADLKGLMVQLPQANLPKGSPLIPGQLNFGDPIQFDVKDGFHKAVLWNNRKIRQRDYSFDQFAQQPSGASVGTEFGGDGWSAIIQPKV